MPFLLYSPPGSSAQPCEPPSHNPPPDSSESHTLPSCVSSADSSASRSARPPSIWTFHHQFSSPHSGGSMPLPSRSPSPATRLAGLPHSPSPFSSYSPSPATYSVGPLLPSASPFPNSPGANFGGGCTPPSDTMSSRAGSLSRRSTPSMVGSGTCTPTPDEEFLSPQGGPISGRSYLPTVFDPAVNPGHLLPAIPPMWHQLDRSWGELQFKLEAVASAGRLATGSNIVVPELGKSQARGYSQVELEWVAGYLRQRRGSADSVQFWETIAEQFNDRFKAEKSGKTLRKRFWRVRNARGGGRRWEGRRWRNGVVAGDVLSVEGMEFGE